MESDEPILAVDLYVFSAKLQGRISAKTTWSLAGDILERLKGINKAKLERKALGEFECDTAVPEIMSVVDMHYRFRNARMGGADL
jgi:hypothetical protein